jgi:hypothetical protein
VREALEHFALSLERAGFREGAEAYTRMANVIMGQRVWAASHGLTRLDDRFREVGTLAGRIYQQLQPYVESMSKLMALQGLVEQEASRGSLELERRILAELEGRRQATSAKAIARALAVDPDSVRGTLDRLVESGLLKARTTGDQSKYRLASSRSRSSASERTPARRTHRR